MTVSVLPAGQYNLGTRLHQKMLPLPELVCTGSSLAAVVLDDNTVEATLLKVFEVVQKIDTPVVGPGLHLLAKLNRMLEIHFVHNSGETRTGRVIQ